MAVVAVSGCTRLYVLCYSCVDLEGKPGPGILFWFKQKEGLPRFREAPETKSYVCVSWLGQLRCYHVVYKKDVFHLASSGRS